MTVVWMILWAVLLGAAAVGVGIVVTVWRRKRLRIASSPRDSLDRRLDRGEIDAAAYTAGLAELVPHDDTDDQASMPWH
jgi:hypothetical protein